MKRLGEVTPHTTPSKIATWDVEGTTPDKRRGPMIPTKASPTKALQKRLNTFSDRIKTYVFFDLECTDLIKNDESRVNSQRSLDRNEDFHSFLNTLCLETRNDEIPYITEMSFMAISRESFDELKDEREIISKFNEENPESKRPLAKYIPTNTHTRLLNPSMNDSEWASYERRRCSDRKGVLVHSRKNCQRNNSFAEEWPAVVQFLELLPKPAVLIGHNALKYDLRVIYGEMARNDMLVQFPMPPNVYFMDSLLMARQIEENMVKNLSTVCKFVNFPKVTLNNDSVDERVVIEDSFCQPIGQDAPPVREPVISNGNFAPDHPSNFLNFDQFSVALRKRIRKDGFMRTSEGGWIYKPFGKNRFSLGALYEELVGGTFSAHFAQQDAEALMHVCLSFGEDFTKFADNMAANIPF